MEIGGTVLPLQKGIIYGPVASRRLGRSLGLNLMPTGFKACSYNCVYCHYGWTKVRTCHMEPLAQELPSVAEVETALAAVLRDGVCPEYITFSGNGEPTLHPDFPEMVEVVIRLRDRLAPRARTCVLSNATALDRPQVVEALTKLDVRIMKLDAGTEETWMAVNRPARELSFACLLEGLKGLKRWVLQAIFFQGSVTNAGPEQIEQWVKRLGELRPCGAQIYTVDRPAADRGLERVPVGVLQEVATRASRATAVPVHVYSQGRTADTGHAQRNAAGEGQDYAREARS
ncbi:MAG: radical SAM protein [Candidatus Oleimicrobiaceae bacterium]